jgi:hypothetical protein
MEKEKTMYHQLVESLVAAFLLFAIPGQAMAAFENNHLVQVVYNESANEAGIDLGDLGTIDFSGADVLLAPAGTVPWASLLAFSSLSVGYFGADTTTYHNWFATTQTSAPTINAGGFSNFQNQGQLVQGVYDSIDVGGVATQSASANPSYDGNMNDGSAAPGSYAGFNTDWQDGETSLSLLSSQGYVDMYLYHYDVITLDKGPDTSTDYTGILRILADGSTVLNPSSGGIAVDYGLLGLHYRGGSGWEKLGGADPDWLCSYGDKLVGAYVGLSVWEYDGASWTKLGGADPDTSGNTMMAFGTGVAIDYGVLGLWHYDGSGAWGKLGGADPERLCVYDDKLVGDYGSLGLWEYDGTLTTWAKLDNRNPDNMGNTMVAFGTGVAIDYGALGLWYFDGTDFTKLGGADPEWLCPYDDKLVGDYGTLGLWEYDDATSTWTKLGGADPDNTGNTIVAYGAGVAIDYGALGLWYYDGTGGWEKLGGANPEWLCAHGDKLVGDYGTLGLWEYDDATSIWTKLGGADPDNSGNCMAEVGF